MIRTLPNKWRGRVHVPDSHHMLIWVEHLLEDEHFWLVVAWIVLIITFAFFAPSPAY